MFELNKENIIFYAFVAVIIYVLFFSKSKLEAFGEAEDLSSNYKMDTNMCSPDCCGSQWPVSFAITRDERIEQDEIGDKYVPTNMTCTGLRGRGCVCSDKQQYEFLKSRGNNS